MKFLANPKATLGVVIGSCLAIDTCCVGIAQAIAPLAHVHGFEQLAPQIQFACAGLGVVSNAAIVAASIGESFVKAISVFQNSVASSGGIATGAAQAPNSTPEKDT